MKTAKFHDLKSPRRAFTFGRVKWLLVMAALLLAVAPALGQPARPPAQKVESISVSPTTMHLKMGESAPLNVTIVPTDVKLDFCTSEDARIAYERNGRIYGGSVEGTTVITAYAGRGAKSATCTVTVTKKEEVKYPLCYEVRINITVRTVTISPSDRNPAPKREEIMQIKGSVVGEVVRGRIEKIASDTDYWWYLRDKGHTPVFIANSDYEVKDDDFNVVFNKRCPLQVNIERTEWDYKDFSRDGMQYVKTLDYRAAGINDKQTIQMGIHPYYEMDVHDPDPVLRPVIRQYVVALNVLTYTEHFAKPIPGNGRMLRWDDQKMKLEPYGNEVSVDVLGRISSREYDEHVTPPLIGEIPLNQYFLNPSGGTKKFILTGKSYEEGNRRSTEINVTLEFRCIADVKATSTIDPPPPPLEDWER
ncbi:Ig-like domain-containing protein [Proteiniphilum acetatigenes]|uniref:Ig-like domain-containing protein n=1 Tax=Proteiniphilum acetatigenes TaxID=294710 RepID=UPI00036D0552|nr:Ig domain-containing protein [Proteiniphilum acetatigenes]SFK63458.1 Ig-like domain (group 2) [Porphyromonadaceae bacterium KH3CP3RA]